MAWSSRPESTTRQSLHCPVWSADILLTLDKPTLMLIKASKNKANTKPVKPSKPNLKTGLSSSVGLMPIVACCLMMMLLLTEKCRGFPVGVLLPSSRPSTAALQQQASQILEFIEPTTGVKVKLVGAMHYNPASIQLTADTINDLARDQRLGSVVIETCDVRWNSTQQFHPLLSWLLNSEMRTAHNLAFHYGRPVVLGDQRINVTVGRLKSAVRETAMDLLSPRKGWKWIAGNLTQAREEAVPLGSEYLGLFSFLEPRLLLAAPVSLVKYPFSYFVKSPLTSALLFALLFWVDSSSASTTKAAMMGKDTSFSDLIPSLMGSALEILFFSRIFLKELLAERNRVLARNILEQCRYYESQPTWKRLTFRKLSETSTYAQFSVRPRYESEKTVVAVLGMAHCNGIRKLLLDQSV
jgi:pheromone shutdown protein TraB